MALVKVFLPTYRRNETFKRAIQSLINQTFTNWICEVHNDDPEDDFPKKYILSLNDSRFIFIQHSLNLGPVSTFNLMYSPSKEKYISLLEDDNWWEPTFLEEMVSLMESNVNIQMSWSNMHIWEEDSEGSYHSLQKTIWNIEENSVIQYFNFPNSKQAYTALHSNGAMLVRNINLQNLITPVHLRFDFVEPVRERACSYPILLNKKPLANFSLTQETTRKKTVLGINEHYYLLLASFFSNPDIANKFCDEIWIETRKSKIRSTNKLIYAGLFDHNCKALLRNAESSDWLFFIAYNLKHPVILFRCIFAKLLYKDLWVFLKSNTQNRFEEASLIKK